MVGTGVHVRQGTVHGGRAHSPRLPAARTHHWLGSWKSGEEGLASQEAVVRGAGRGPWAQGSMLAQSPCRQLTPSMDRQLMLLWLLLLLLLGPAAGVPVRTRPAPKVQRQPAAWAAAAALASAAVVVLGLRRRHSNVSCMRAGARGASGRACQLCLQPHAAWLHHIRPPASTEAAVSTPCNLHNYAR